MVFRLTSTKKAARHPRSLAGIVLAEFMVALGITAVAMLAITAIVMFSGQSFAALANYIDLDDDNRVAMDTLTRDLRQAKEVIGSTSNSLTMANVDGSTVRYYYNVDARTLSRIADGSATIILRECDKLNFSLGQRNTVGGSYDVYPAATPATAKVVNVRWLCSRSILGMKENTESVQTARIVIRKQGT